MTDDLISRAAALQIGSAYGWDTELFQSAISALPAVAAVKTDSQQVRVKPRNVDRFNLCLTLEDNTATATMQADEDGYWVRISDYEAILAIETQPDPRDAVIARQAEALAAANAYITDLIRHEGQEGFSNSTYDLGVAYDKALAAIETQPNPRDAVIAQLVEALEKSREGWANAIELGIIHKNHVTSAGILHDEAAAALAAAKGNAA